MLLKNIDDLFENKYFTYSVCILISLYVTFLEFRLNPVLNNLFSNPVFRIIFISLIVFMFEKNSQIAIILAILYLVISNYYVNRDIPVETTEESKEHFKDTITKQNTSKLQTCTRILSEIDEKCKHLPTLEECKFFNKKVDEINSITEDIQLKLRQLKQQENGSDLQDFEMSFEKQLQRTQPLENFD